MQKIGIIKSISYSLINGIEVEILGYNYIYSIKPDQLHFGGKNCELSRLVVGGKISFELETMRKLANVTIISDGISEIDQTEIL